MEHLLEEDMINGTLNRPTALSVPVQDSLQTRRGKGSLTPKRVVLEGHRVAESNSRHAYLKITVGSVA